MQRHAAADLPDLNIGMPRILLQKLPVKLLGLDKLPSLRLHIRAAGEAPAAEQTEVKWMNGAVAGFGRLNDIPTPINSRLAELVDEVAAHPDRRAWFRHHPERLMAELEARRP